jgi:hypothetical protein
MYRNGVLANVIFAPAGQKPQFYLPSSRNYRGEPTCLALGHFLIRLFSYCWVIWVLCIFQIIGFFKCQMWIGQTTLHPPHLDIHNTYDHLEGSEKSHSKKISVLQICPTLILPKTRSLLIFCRTNIAGRHHLFKKFRETSSTIGAGFVQPWRGDEPLCCLEFSFVKCQ